MFALIFPGQGSQNIGMARDFYDNFTVVRQIFSNISDSAKIDVKKIIFEDKIKLNLTEFTQICIFTVSISIYSIIKEIYGDKFLQKIKFMAGHSLGEYSAICSAEALSIEKCAQLLKLRGNFMQNSDPKNKSGMLAIIGLNMEKIENIQLENENLFEIANDNAPGQVVISLEKNNFKTTKNILLNKGAKKVIPLNVSAAFHSSFMAPAEESMIKELDKIKLNESKYPIISNFNAKASMNPNNILENLKKQIRNRVRWVETINFLEKEKINNLLEIGPGKVLTGLCKTINKNFNSYNISNINELENFKNVF